MSKSTSQKKPPTKTQVIATLSLVTGLPKANVAAVLSALNDEIGKCLTAREPRKFVIPGIIEFRKEFVPARPAQKGVPNPFKPGELIDRPAKPASSKIKVRALEPLKKAVFGDDDLSEPGERDYITAIVGSGPIYARLGRIIEGLKHRNPDMISVARMFLA